MTDIDTVTTSNSVRLSGRQWIGLAAFTALVYLLVPKIWSALETFETPADYRVPYALGNDYWLFDRWSRRAAEGHETLVVGDSVVWGHFVGADQTLPHHLNALAGKARFANLGLDGSHPAALAGLVEHYGSGIRDREVVLQCNLTWMSAPQPDLRDPELRPDQVFPYNHGPLLPQFSPAIPCYRENLSRRLGHAMDRKVEMSAWSRHLQVAYFEGKSIPAWSLDHPYRSPQTAVTLRVGPADDRLEEPISWTARGLKKQNLPWVDLETSIQWASFRRALATLRARGNRVLVVVGPYNEHLLTDASLERYRAVKAAIADWLRAQGVPTAVLEPLPSETYADASHPLDAGYALMARRILEHEFFKGAGASTLPALAPR
jgi:hypothetical protein